jgi:hypothetical protein
MKLHPAFPDDIVSAVFQTKAIPFQNGESYANMSLL